MWDFEESRLFVICEFWKSWVHNEWKNVQQWWLVITQVKYEESLAKPAGFDLIDFGEQYNNYRTIIIILGKQYIFYYIV